MTERFDWQPAAPTDPSAVDDGPGLYLFRRAGEVVYIGSGTAAEKGALRSRLSSHLRASDTAWFFYTAAGDALFLPWLKTEGHAGRLDRFESLADLRKAFAAEQLADLDVAWLVCEDDDAAKDLEQHLIEELDPTFVRRGPRPRRGQA